MTQKVLRLSGQLQLMESEGHQYAMITNASQLATLPFDQVHGIVLHSDWERESLKVLHTLRSSRELHHYLMPVFLQYPSEHKLLAQQVDGAWERQSAYQIKRQVVAIWERLAELRHARPADGSKESLLLKTVQYIYSRGQKLSAKRDRNALIGYTYPFLNSFWAVEDNLHLVEHLAEFQREGYLEGKLVDKVNLCTECDSSYLNFRETCSKCGSLELETENLIHHFRCAYVGPESDFQRDNQLICPKCDKKLRHIGIDYDKPSEISNCQTCGHHAQDTPMKAACVDCGHEMDLDAIHTRPIYDYTLSELGAQIAKQGLARHNASNFPSSLPIGTIGWEFFQLVLQQELERTKLRPGSSFIGSLQLNTEAFHFLGPDTKEQLRHEILTIIRSYLRAADVLSSKGFDHYLFILPEMTLEEAADLEDLLQYNLSKLIGDNFTDIQPYVEVLLQPLSTNLDPCILS
ncbi:MAG: hypothetical protein AAF798_14725 [Bacteroidota bacterium]